MRVPKDILILVFLKLFLAKIKKSYIFVSNSKTIYL